MMEQPSERGFNY